MQAANAQIRKIPAEVTNAFAEKYGGAKNVEWKDNLSVFVAGFEQDGENMKSNSTKKENGKVRKSR